VGDNADRSAIMNIDSNIPYNCVEIVPVFGVIDLSPGL